MQPPVFFFVGKPQHGKTTARKIVEQLTQLKGGSCSDVVYHYLAARRGTTVGELRKIPKEELRPALCQAGDFLCGLGEPLAEAPANPAVDGQMYRIPSALIRTLYVSGYNVIDGVRRRLELQSARDHLDWNGVQSLVVYIDRPGQAEISDNTEDLRDLADEVVVNDGSLEDLGKKISDILKARYGADPAPSETPQAEPAPVADTSGV